jgi:hypothetical protein
MATQARAKKGVSEKVSARLAEVARELRAELYGEEGYPGWGTKFVEIEEQVLAIGHDLARQLAEQALAEQARHVPPQAMKDVTGEEAEPGGTEQRELETPAGVVSWPEPQAYLPNSRKAFFPSGSRIGDKRG